MLVTSIPQYVQGLLNVKIDLATTDKKTMYTAPSNADFNASVIHSMLVMNTSSSASTLTVTITGDGVDGGSGAVTNHEFFYTTNSGMNAFTTVEFLPNVSKNLILNAGEVIKVQAGHANRISVILSIEEYAVVRTPQVDL